MGSMIYLAIGELQVDWSKNYVSRMHGDLFQPHDVKPALYRYADDYEVLKEAAVRPLGRMVGRLELLGFTLHGARREYEGRAASVGPDRPPMSFDIFADALRKLDVDAVAADYRTDYRFGEAFAREIFDRQGVSSYGLDPKNARYQLGAFMENVDPYVLLRLLAENPASASREVTWDFADVVEGGWVDREEIIKSLGAQRGFLVVTEGSSDAATLKRALELLRPDVADFFYFVDMEEGYPFTGTGNLHKFTHGLASIAIENRAVIVYDNDAEGVSKFAETSKLRLPPNIRVMKLPDHNSLSSFATIGPQGERALDINGRAAALECYLDLSWRTHEPPVVRWTGYNASLGDYQGELLRKQTYTKRFLDLRKPEAGYDFAKLDAVLTALLSECVTIATAS